MDITAGSGCNGAQEIPCHDYVCRRAADAMGRFRGDTAGTVGAEAAADALKPEAAFDGLPSTLWWDVSIGSPAMYPSNGLSALLQVVQL